MRQGRTKKNFTIFMFSLWILVMLVLVWRAIWLHFYASEILYPRAPFGYKGNWLVYCVYGVLVMAFTTFYGGYRIGHNRRTDVILSGLLAMVFANAITFLQTCLIARAMVNIWPVILMSAIDAALIWAWGLASYALYVRLFPPHEMLLVYGGGDLARSLVKKMSERSEKYRIREAVKIEEGVEEIQERILHFNAVILCDVPPKERNRLLKYCFEQSIRTYSVPKISDILVRGAQNITLFDTPLLLNRNQGLDYAQQLIKRAMDVVLSAIAIVLCAPFMLVISVLIKLHDGGPVLYKQERLTQDGRIFMIYKFRSMVQNAEEENGAQLATARDPRITPVGHFLRKFRLDELPQIFNIFGGSMSLVGPRPERPEIAAEYYESMPEFAFRLKVKAGLTGYAQVMGKYNTTPYDKLKMDLMYIAGYSVLEDIKIIFMTPKVLFMKESTEGVDNGEITR